MIFLYTLLLVALGALKFLIELRSAFLARRYSRLAGAVDKLAREPILRDGNNNRFNPCEIARRQYLLGSLVQKKERLEARHYRWQHLADKLSRAVSRLRSWKGRKLPYTLGALDVWLTLYLVDYFGAADYVNAGNVLHLLGSLLAE
jgi:hypothetical protein